VGDRAATLLGAGRRVIGLPPGDDCRIGLDMIPVRAVEEAVATHGERYLRRIFTEHELASCRGPQGLALASLAARWAAKEATIKVLQPAVGQPEWRSMEVRRIRGGACRMELSGTAAALAEDAGITSLALSMTHEGPYAAAVVFALCGAPGSARSGTSGRKETTDA